MIWRRQDIKIQIGQSEIGVKILKDGLRRLCNHAQDDWDLHIDTFLFSYNNSIHSSTGFSPFFMMFSFVPLVFPDFGSRSVSSLYSAFKKYQKCLLTAHDNIAKSHENQRLQYDKRRSLEFNFEVSDLVLLDRNGINSATISDSPNVFLPLYIGPFEILAVDIVRQNYTLKLPLSMRCFNVFHVRCLKRYYKPTEFFPARDVMDEPDPVIVEKGFE